MMVLKNVRGEWRLFWVFEVIGLSFGLAVLVVKVTGNDGAVDGQEEEHRCTLESSGTGCWIYDWSFILHLHPTAVTVCALLLTSAISRPRSFFGRCPHSRFTLFLFLWVLKGIVSAVMGDAYAFGSVVSGFCAVVYVCRNRRAVELALASANRRLRVVDRRRRTILFGAGVVVYAGIFLLLTFRSRTVQNLAWDVVGALDGCMSLLIHAWLVFGMGSANLRSIEHQLPHAPNQSARIPCMVPILLGWVCGELLCTAEKIWMLVPLNQLFFLTGSLVLGTCLWGGVAEKMTVALWAAATVLRDVVMNCAVTWVLARVGNKVI